MAGVLEDKTVVSAGGAHLDPVVRCDNLVKIYQQAGLEVIALQGLDLVVERGEFTAIVGASGSGKSTLLGVLGGLVVPTAGGAVVAGHDLLQMSPRDRTNYRRREVGFVWQQAVRNLVPYLSALENVELPMRLDGRPRRIRRARALDLLDRVGLAGRTHHRPVQLSGGEQQRVAIATALANLPTVLLADEPTGELDSQTAAEIIGALRSVNQEDGVTVLIVTHDLQLAGGADRTVSIRDGRTSTEVLRRATIDAEGTTEVVAEEFAVLDRVGRLQLPDDYVVALQLERRVRLTLGSDRINVWPDRAATNPESDRSDE